MKTMTCRQLAGACDKAFHANSFDEIAELSKSHAMEMAQKGDLAHIKKMEEMMSLMNNPQSMNEWFTKVRREFEELPEDN